MNDTLDILIGVALLVLVFGFLLLAFDPNFAAAVFGH